MNEFVIIDLETTGLDSDRDSIIEVAAVKVKRGLIVDQFSTLVNCGQPLNDFVIDLTGISDQMLIDQPRIDEVIQPLADFIGDAVICAHNAEFDHSFLHKSWSDEREWLDTITFSQIIYPCVPSYSLSWLIGMLGIVNSSAHRALADALATAELFIILKKKLALLPEKAKNDLLMIAGDNSNPLDQLIYRECSMTGGSYDTSKERKVSKRIVQKEDNSYINDDFCVDISHLAEYLTVEGKYASRMNGFEDRPQQLLMSKEVADAFNDHHFLLAEAGTGTGKSLAYLLPSALYAVGSGKKVAISTHTKNLQEQLLSKDIPLLSEILDIPIKASVLKGRGNYLCRRLYGAYLKQPPENIRYFLMRIAVWRASTNSGDGDELSLTGYEQWKWQRICASRENCAAFCPYHKNGGCYVQKSRIEANNSNIYILNHSLLIANSAMETSFLPVFSNLVIDEAHHLEKAAEEQLAADVDFYTLLSLLGRLKRREKGKETGALISLRHYASGMFFSEIGREILNKQLDDLDSGITDNLSAGEDFFGILGEFFKADAQRESFYPATVRIREKHYIDDDWLLIIDKGNSLIDNLNQLARQCFRILDILQSESSEADEDQYIPGKDELQSIGSLAREMAATLTSCIKKDQDNYVAWVKYADADRKPSLNIAPIELGELLRNCLFEKCDAAVLTSATITTGKSFGFFKHRLGLDLLPDQPRELVVQSPFMYKDQSLFAIVDDLPDWSKSSTIISTKALADCLIKLLSASKGRAIVLFTSHHQLRAVYNEIRRPLQENGITVLAHGINGGPVQLLHRLKNENNCAILGANSFWEGVDVIGSALSLIVIVRLPFWPPNTPTTASRMERIEAAGRSSFAEYSMPQAILRFKQGFGRLIRSSEDSGVFCVLDRRIFEKGYGKNFTRSLPDMQCVRGNSDYIADSISDWLG